MTLNKIAILTSGGDAPGMNCAIRSVVRYAYHLGVKVVGVARGYQGLINREFRMMGPRDVSNIISEGGTVLKTVRSADFAEKPGREKAYANLMQAGIEGFIVIGGNGSFQGAEVFFQEFDFPVIGIPGTIDNDVFGTQCTLGFDTALNTAMDAIDKIRDTASSMDRIFLIEVMGRHSGAIAVHSAIAGGAEDIVMPDEKCNITSICAKIEQGRKSGKNSWIIIVAEGAGWTQKLAEELIKFAYDVRVTVIGHIQRGGSPSAFDRFLGAVMGKTAVDALLQGNTHHAIGWVNDKTFVYPLNQAVQRKDESYSDFLKLIQILT
jgi:6-phosphofructokinase 1